MTVMIVKYNRSYAVRDIYPGRFLKLAPFVNIPFYQFERSFGHICELLVLISWIGIEKRHFPIIKQGLLTRYKIQPIMLPLLTVSDRKGIKYGVVVCANLQSVHVTFCSLQPDNVHRNLSS